MRNPHQESTLVCGSMQRSMEWGEDHSSLSFLSWSFPLPRVVARFLRAGLERCATLSHLSLFRSDWDLLGLGVKLPFSFWGRRTSFLTKDTEVTSPAQTHADGWSFLEQGWKCWSSDLRMLGIVACFKGLKQDGASTMA